MFPRGGAIVFIGFALFLILSENTRRVVLKSILVLSALEVQIRVEQFRFRGWEGGGEDAGF